MATELQANEPSADASALRAVETMRLGVVPSAEPSAYTVGRDAELAVVDADLARAADANQGGAVRCLVGDYGTGKTHMLELIRHRALAQNFVVAGAVLDPEETPPSHPKRVYRALMGSLLYPDRPDDHGLGLLPLLERASRSEQALERFGCARRGQAMLDRGDHLYLTPALRYARAFLGDDKVDDEARRWGLSVLLRWLEGEPTDFTGSIDSDLAGCAPRRQGRIYAMMDYRPWARIYGYILSGLSLMARHAGYAGLVVLLDEAEFYALLNRSNRDFARTLFKALACAAVGEEAVPFDRSELDLGGSGVQQELPPRFDPHSGLYTVFAMTPSNEGVDALGEAVPDDSWTELSRLSRADYRDLVARVLEVYRAARPELALADGLVDPLTKVVGGMVDTGIIQNPRQAMKFLIEFFDLAYHRPKDLKTVFREMRDGLMIF